MTVTYNKILVPIDFSSFSRNALRYAIHFAEQFKASLHLLYVSEPVIYPPDFSMGQIAVAASTLEIEKQASVELQKLAESEIGSRLPYTVSIRAGKPFVEIIEAAKEDDADLIIISTHGHSGVEQILFGSTADKVVRKSPCPVLTLREPIKGFDYKKKL